MKTLYKYPNFQQVYELGKQDGLVVGTLIGYNPKQNPLGSFDSIFGILQSSFQNLFACLETKMNRLRSDSNISFRFKANYNNVFVEVRVNFEEDKIFAEMISNRDMICGRDVFEDFHTIVTTAISMSVEI